MSQAEEFQMFVGGTLVEYKESNGFLVEWGRAEIVRVGPFRNGGDESVSLETNERACFGTNYVNRRDFHEHEGVTYIDRARGLPFTTACYAIAPPGVMIPFPSQRNGFKPERLFR